MPGFLLPAATGFALAQCFAYDWLGATIIAMCLSITALPVALRILSGFGLLGTQLAQIAIAGALLADVIVLLTLGMLTPVAGANPASIGALVGLGALKLCALLGLVAAGAWASSRVHRYRGSPTRTTAAAQSTFALLLILLLAAASDALGLHFAIGAFLGALSVTEFHRDGGALHPLHRKLAGMVNFVFAPLFLACQGTQFTTGTLALTVFTTALTFAAIGSKLVGGYWSALCFGLARHEARGVAIVMNARGMMEMVIASIAFGAGLVDASLFSTLLIVGMITTMCTPLLLRQWQQHQALA
jgi:Kef-type K+ transport system membrane component KefB